MQKGGRDPGDKTSHDRGFGSSLLNKLPSESRKRRKRGADKTRRQTQAAIVRAEFEE